MSPEAEEQWVAVTSWRISPQQWERFAAYMEEIFTALGLLVGTPSATGSRVREQLKRVQHSCPTLPRLAQEQPGAHASGRGGACVIHRAPAL
ncbi:hypothetical protein [Actinacidiphila oryziradicis]|uniref:Uncharacterized protein n=1 Tax=Actinacidiphila oryziradicis TaxID=2571141 RepID=A0A4U0S2M3_9ACTN|nr:hypothetical protein [Actinacidiphila oryziradicis]TKA03164.1 hypothetical protein FCI23_37045 [Actinacidiphila oryziradicis]